MESTTSIERKAEAGFAGAHGSATEYSLYHHPCGYWQLWSGLKHCRPNRMIRTLLPESVRMMQRNDMIQRVGINGMIVKLPNDAHQRRAGANRELES